MPFDLLPADNAVTSMFKKTACCNGSMGLDRPLHRPLQFIAQSGGNSFPLMVPVYIQAVEIARCINVPKSDNFSLFNSNQAVVRQKGPVPSLKIRLSVRPGIQLLRGVIAGVYRVYCSVKQFGNYSTICGLIHSDFHLFLPFSKLLDPKGPANPVGGIFEKTADQPELNENIVRDIFQPKAGFFKQ